MHVRAKLADGTYLEDPECTSVTQLPVERITELTVTREGSGPVSLRADVTVGERVHFFTRNSISVGSDSAVTTVPVYEVRKGDAPLLRLYCHPELGPILTTQDLYF